MDNNIQYPRIHNADTSTQLIGIAYDKPNNKIYYCSNAGYGVSVKAIFSSMASNSAKNLGCTHLGFNSATGANPITQWTAQLPDTQIQHSVACYRDHDLLIVSDANAAALMDTEDPEVVDQRQYLLEDHMPRMHQQLGLFLNQQTDVPVHKSWYDTLWRYALGEAITPLTTFGDCLGAWLVDPKYDWLTLTQELLADDTISWPSN